MEAACPETDKQQLLFDAVIDPKDVRIPLDSTLRTPLMSTLDGAYFRDVDEPGGGLMVPLLTVRSHRVPRPCGHW